MALMCAGVITPAGAVWPGGCSPKADQNENSPVVDIYCPGIIIIG